MLLVIIVVLIVLLLTYELFYERKLKACASRLPGFPMIPLLGNAHQIKPTPAGIFKFTTKTSEYGKVSRIMVGPVLFVVLTDPADIEFVTTDSRLTNKSAEYNFLQPWLGEGLITSGGSKWQTRRKLLSPSFHFNVLKDYIPVFEKNADILVQKLSKNPGELVDVYPLIALCTLDTISETAMGVKLDAQFGHHAEYVKAVARMYCKGVFIEANVLFENEEGEETFRTSSAAMSTKEWSKDGMAVRIRMTLISNRRVVDLWWKFDFFFKWMPVYKEYKEQLKILHDMTNSVIKERKQALEKERVMNGNLVIDPSSDIGIKKRQSFLDTLLSSETVKGKLSDDDIREEVDTFMFAGHDTTSVTMGFLLYNMAMNPDIQEKVYQELLSIYGDDPNRKLTNEDLTSMKYMEMVIKESMRLHATVPSIIRKAPFDFNLNGTEIPAGSSILLNIFSMNRNPEVFPDPMKFIPERFSLEESSKRHNFSIISFSAGRRNCIGQKFAMTEMKCIFSKCIKGLEFLPGDIELELGSAIVLKSYNGINLRIRKRH